MSQPFPFSECRFAVFLGLSAFAGKRLRALVLHRPRAHRTCQPKFWVDNARDQLDTFRKALTGGCTNGDSGTFTATRVTATVLDLAGKWEASTDSILGFSTFLSGTFTQTGNQISGTMSIISG